MTSSAPADRPRILLVDDDPNILHGLRRQLRGAYDVRLADNGRDALAMLASNGPFAAIVSDMHMPGMNGLKTLSRAAEIAPDTVRVMLTGQADISTAVRSINEGGIFLFLTKPCSAEELRKGVDRAVKQNQLLESERTLLQQTLVGSAKLMTDVLAMVLPGYSKNEHTRRICHAVAGAIEKPDFAWKLELAVLLSPVGAAALPQGLNEKIRTGAALSEVEEKLYGATAAIGHKLIGNIPRLDEVADFVKYSLKNYDGSGEPQDGRQGAGIPLGGRLVRILNELIRELDQRPDPEATLARLSRQPDKFDCELIERIEESITLAIYDAIEAKQGVIEAPLFDLKVGDVLVAPIVDLATNRTLLARGAVLDRVQIDHIHRSQMICKLGDSVLVNRAAGQGAPAASVQPEFSR